ncbi:uncharacterized protein LOC120706376 [Panicum virgatum]|uniref:PGG domain-containing protein n=1 Tax=Panicum virgatum TaxID=38727 RepID=A0A8T0SJK8_PANVG|nr:uncharacterized protein LOC120706376 [Panicum virgatum]KAG2596489.1 hypothetical protein PVAP13_5KG165200 [Panicum virgatum]
MDDGAGNGNGHHVQMVELGQLPGGDNPPQNAGAAVAGGGGGGHAPDFDANDAGTLLVVATLISGLSYQLGTNIPGGYWQDDAAGHVAGDPIMRDKHRRRYWLFMSGSWVAFGSSMLLTVGLLTGVPAGSRFIRAAFLVAYSSLVLTFVTSQPRTSLAIDIAIWVGVMAALAVVTSYLRLDRLPTWAQAAFRQLLGR